MEEKNKTTSYVYEPHIPSMEADGLAIIVDYIKKNEVRSILEIGTAVGFSAIIMAGQHEDIQVDSLEIKEDRYNQALVNISSINLEDRIHVHLMDAIDFVTDKKYDLVFVDGPKAQYKSHMDHFMGNLADDGIFIFDNLEFHGMVDDPSLTDNRNTKDLVRKIGDFRNEMLARDDFHVKYFKKVGDGVMFVKPKKIVNE